MLIVVVVCVLLCLLFRDLFVQTHLPPARLDYVYNPVYAYHILYIYIHIILMCFDCCIAQVSHVFFKMFLCIAKSILKQLHSFDICWPCSALNHLLFVLKKKRFIPSEKPKLLFFTKAL